MTNDQPTKETKTGFHDLGITPNIVRAIERLKFKNPTPIQQESIPAGIEGNDLLAIAQTGSGKTMAFGIPMLQRLSGMGRGNGLIMVPTRELAIQVEESLQPICRAANIRSVVLIGGASMSAQVTALRKNPRIIIATPGRLMDHIEKKKVNLGHIEIFVLDEADRMLDMGFIPDIKRVVKLIPSKSQTMLFSATMPKEIEAIAATLMDEPIRIETDRSGATPNEVSHEMFVLKKADKGRLLTSRLEQCSGPVLVFTKTKWMAKKLTAKVIKLGFAAAEIHSNRSQGQRRAALEGFRRGKYQVLIATDIAARGIDVTGIEMVINYDMPANSEDYVHRIGRTGRAGKTGRAVTFATADQKNAIKDLERFMKTKLPITDLPNMLAEKPLAKKLDQTNAKAVTSVDSVSSDRKASLDRPSKRPESRESVRASQKRTQPGKKTNKRKNSERRDSRDQGSHSGGLKSEFKRKDSKRRTVRGQAARSGSLKRTGLKMPDLGQAEFRRQDAALLGLKPKKKKEKKETKPRIEKKEKREKLSVESNQFDSNNKSPFWVFFNKNKPSKKRRSGGGSAPKKRSKRK